MNDSSVGEKDFKFGATILVGLALLAIVLAIVG
jgi:hypothetical protein